MGISGWGPTVVVVSVVVVGASVVCACVVSLPVVASLVASVEPVGSPQPEKGANNARVQTKTCGRIFMLANANRAVNTTTGPDTLAHPPAPRKLSVESAPHPMSHKQAVATHERK